MSDRELPSPELLRKLLRYEPETGKLFWRPRPMEMFPDERSSKIWNVRFAHQEAFSLIHTDGHLRGRIFGKNYYAHRVIWAIQTGAWPNSGIDHVNGKKADNSWVNLREASHSENMSNRRSYEGSASQYRGVRLHKRTNRWYAEIQRNGRKIHLGAFSSEEDAARAYDAVAPQHHGKFARLNFSAPLTQTACKL